MSRPGTRWLKLVLLLLALPLSGCDSGESPSLAEVLSGELLSPEWTALAGVESFDKDSLFDLVDGQADAFFAYAFERVVVRRYQNTIGATCDVEIWRLATPADAYGLFTSNLTGTPVPIGNGGAADPGRRLVFWQDRTYVRIRARQELPDAELRDIAEALSDALPVGGERPALVDRLPPEGLLANSLLFFHEQISIQDRLWLGGENLLSLSPQTDGVLAQYRFDGADAQLLLVQYAAADAASEGLAALKGVIEAGVVAGDVSGNLLGAIFGAIDEAAARELLDQALARE